MRPVEQIHVHVSKQCYHRFSLKTLQSHGNTCSFVQLMVEHKHGERKIGFHLKIENVDDLF